MSNQANLLVAADIEALDTRLDMTSVDSLMWWERILMDAGSKEQPTVLDFGQYHNDGWPIEWAFNPASHPDQFIENDLRMRQHIETHHGVQLYGRDWFEVPMTLVSQNVRLFTHLAGRANRLGCAPDFIEGRERRITGRARVVRTRALREAGLHFHLNLRPEFCSTQDPAACLEVVRDFAEATKLWHKWDHPSERPWYRVSGSYRPKPYGVEYRSLGSSVINDMGEYRLLVDTVFAFMREHWRLGGYVI